MEHIEYWLNAFPSTDSILDTVGPANLVEGKPNVDCNKSFVPFGAYTLVYIGTNNTLDARTVAAIALNAANESGGYYFMSLETGKRIHSKQWDVLPISNNVIDTVNDLGNEQQQPTLKHRVPLFEWAPGIEIDVPNDDDDEELINKIADNQPILDIQEFNDATEQNMVTDDEEDDNSISSNISSESNNSSNTNSSNQSSHIENIALSNDHETIGETDNLSLPTDDEPTNFVDIEYNSEGMNEENISIDSNDYSLADPDDYIPTPLRIIVTTVSLKKRWTK